jgi:hypothetical protein
MELAAAAFMNRKSCDGVAESFARDAPLASHGPNVTVKLTLFEPLAKH